MRGHFRWAGLLALTIVCSLVPNAASAGRGRSVRIGIEESRGPSHASATESLFREALRDQVGHLAGVEATPPGRADVLVQGSITSIQRSMSGQEARVRCEVSVIVTERKTGSMKMILTGRAEARGPARQELVRDAVEAAVRSALRPLAGGSLLRS